jgi:hypothetical protein
MMIKSCCCVGCGVVVVVAVVVGELDEREDMFQSSSAATVSQNWFSPPINVVLGQDQKSGVAR